MQTLYTVDTELSLAMQGGGASPEANYRSAILGETSRGKFGVPYQLDLLDRYGLKGVFFVEALHIMVIGDEMLKRIVALVLERGHEVQLHCHVEWLWFAKGAQRLPREKQSLAHLSLAEQSELLGTAKDALERCGAPPPNAFRAGNYGANDDTLRTLAKLGIRYDSSHNGTVADSRIALPAEQIAPCERHGVIEVPVSWFFAGGARRRHAQLCAASYSELDHALAEAQAAGHPLFTIVSHSFELLDRARKRPQGLVVRRFEKLCALLAERGTAGFRDLVDVSGSCTAPRPIRSNAARTAARIAEQALGNLIYERRAG